MRREVVVESRGEQLAGALHSPTRAVAGVVMVGGSGPTDRDNDVLFPPLRDHLVGRGVAVLSCDKPGVGGSSGDWRTATLNDLASDAIAILEKLRRTSGLSRVGLFGHSEGGWVVLRAAARSDPGFVVTNGCPGVTPGEQDRHALANVMGDDAVPGPDRTAAVAAYDALLDAGRSGASFADVESLPTPTLSRYWGDLDEPMWRFLVRKQDHDVRPDLARLPCPCLAVLGEADRLVPVPISERVFVDAGARVLVLPHADHRAQVGGRFAPGFLAAVTDAVLGR